MKGLAVVYLSLVALLVVWAWASSAQGRWVGSVRLFGPLLAWPLPLVALLSVREKGLRWPCLGLTLLFLAWCPPALNLAARPEGGLRIVTWNSEGASALELPEADIVALQETDQRLLERHPYPYSWWRNSDRAPVSMALLSRFPIVDRGLLGSSEQYCPDCEWWRAPEGAEQACPSCGKPFSSLKKGAAEPEVWDIGRVMWARLDLGEGKSMVVINAHPIPPYRGLTHFSPGERDLQLRALRRQLVEPLLQGAEPFVLLGDLNTVEREPVFRELSQGLRDSLPTAGLGYQNTWAPFGLPLSLLRLDYALCSPSASVLSHQRLAAPAGAEHSPLLVRIKI